MKPYDRIASEYYDDSHKTSRAFDFVTRESLTANNPVPLDGLVLDAGCGKGRCVEFLGVDPNRVVHLDNCRAMFALQHREPCLLRVLHDAEVLPFPDAEFGCVAAFLCDPFFGPNFLAEAYRVLRQNGVFIATLPSHEWAHALRAQLGIGVDTTRFVIHNNETVVVPSVVVPTVQCIAMLELAGFSHAAISTRPLRLPAGYLSPSADLVTAASALGRDQAAVEIVNLIVARKD